MYSQRVAQWILNSSLYVNDKYASFVVYMGVVEIRDEKAVYQFALDCSLRIFLAKNCVSIFHFFPTIATRSPEVQYLALVVEIQS